VLARRQSVTVVVFLELATLLSFAGDDPLKALDHRLYLIAGEGASNCGIVPVKQSPRDANRCVRKALSAKKAFYVRYDLPSMDSSVGAGLAGNTDGDVFLVEFDTLGFTPGMQKSNEKLLDDGHSIVEECPKPIRLREPGFLGRGLTCLRPSKNPPGEIMSPK
jgi:hypothetical protein